MDLIKDVEAKGKMIAGMRIEKKHLKELNASSYNNFITLEYDCLKSERLDKYNEIPFD